MKKLAIIIPVYNEEDNIKKILNDWGNILNNKEFDIIIVNDGSTDNTSFILNQKKKSNIKILNKINSGHGDFVITGYRYALVNNYKFIFQVDSDNQFSAKDFKKLWKLKDFNYDILMGYRKNRKDPIIRIFLSKVVLRFFFILFFQKNIHDANVPFRLIKNDFLKKFMINCNKKYIAPNILMSIFAKKIIFIKVKHFQRTKGEIKWNAQKLLSFGIRLIIEIFYFKINIKN